jgi:glycosyltransferase involved in cell wall biosynthesis
VPRVVYDSQVFAEQEHGGVSRYFLALAGRLPEVSAWEPMLALGIHIVADPMPRNAWLVGPRLRVPYLPHTFRVKQRANAMIMRAFQPRDDGATVYHPTWYHGHSIAAWSRLPVAVTIHDLIPEAWPGVTTPAQLADRKSVLERARVVICVSQSTMNKLAEHYPFAAERAVVARLGIPELPTPSTVPPAEAPYLVHVGKRGAYKDFATVIKSLRHVAGEVGLVAVGGGDASPREEHLLESTGLLDRVRFETHVSDQRLVDILAGSQGLISASREEGFGLPPLEALAAGKPVILSDIAVYRELYARWATFFPVGDPEALAQAISLRLGGGGPALPERKELGSIFSWDETARLTSKAYEKALG